jgi:UDP-3-O-[3-hydroxymyristoyl] glucosamine N-acyltransferase
MSGDRSIAELAELVGGRVLRAGKGARVRRVMPVEGALEDAVTFVARPKFLRHLATTRAAAVMVAEEMLERDPVALPDSLAVIGVEQPYVAFARAAQFFAERVPQPAGIHASAAIDPAAVIGAGVSIGPFVYIGAGASIGEGAVLYAGVHVEPGAVIGAGSVLYNHVVVRHRCTIGARCILHPGVVIGSDGFGFAQEIDPKDGTPQSHVKIPQTGDVVLGDDVEIGSNTCVDRATLGTTRIGAGTKIDNLVQIGHNVQIGERCILVAQSGVAGSSKLGTGVIVGAQGGISGHVAIGDGVVVYGQSGVISDVEPGARICGTPAVPVQEFFRNVVRVSKLDALMSRVRKLERLLGGERAA